MAEVLLVVASKDRDNQNQVQVGSWIEQLAQPYYFFKDSKANLTIASPLGGAAPISLKSLKFSHSAYPAKFMKDCSARSELADTVPLSRVYPSDFSAIYYVGGDSCLWDFPTDEHSNNLVAYSLRNGIPIAFCAQAISAVLGLRDDERKRLISGRNVTTIRIQEEVQLLDTKHYPYFIEDKVRTLGGKLSKSEPFSSTVVENDLFLSGQNCNSAHELAVRLFSKISARK